MSLFGAPPAYVSPLLSLVRTDAVVAGKQKQLQFRHTSSRRRTALSLRPTSSAINSSPFILPLRRSETHSASSLRRPSTNNKFPFSLRRSPRSSRRPKIQLRCACGRYAPCRESLGSSCARASDGRIVWSSSTAWRTWIRGAGAETSLWSIVRTFSWILGVFRARLGECVVDFD